MLCGVLSTESQLPFGLGPADEWRPDEAVGVCFPMTLQKRPALVDFQHAGAAVRGFLPSFLLGISYPSTLKFPKQNYSDTLLHQTPKTAL